MIVEVTIGGTLMRNFKRPVYQNYSTVYILVIAIVLTAIIGGKATHQGVVLGLVSIVVGLLLIYRSRNSHKSLVLINTVVFCLLELTACIVVAFGGDPTELWFASFYAIFALLMVFESMVMRRIR
jgi:ABC-type branched-subunit amino acid transport system permease subunit